MKQFAGIVFDMDGLMFDSEAIVKRAWDKVGPLIGYEPLGHNIYHTLGMNAARRRQYFAEQYGEQFPYDHFSDLYREACQVDMQEHGVPKKKGLIYLLDWLKEQGVPLAVATGSSEKFALRKLEEGGCRSYFKVIICGNMIEKSKPDPEIYLKACEQLKVDPRQALALEDSPNGIRSALNAGMQVIMVPDLIPDAGELESYLYGKVSDLTQVVELLK